MVATQPVPVSEEQRAQFREARMSRDRRFDGQFFIAVKSTGIFCRTVCPARLPAEENVDYFPLAVQAMQAGFRPCLRCRPDSAPGSSAWLGVNTTVNRAQRLLAELPPQPVAVIARRLGISERYLHGLLTDQIGLAPKTFQVFHQLLFAKQLLQQSTLSVTDISLMCGFDSVRRLQSLMQKHWKLSPSQLRKQSSGARSAQATSKLSLSLAYRPPYHWPWVRDFLQRRQLQLSETITAHSYQRTFVEQGVAGCVDITHNEHRNLFELTLQIDDVRYAHKVVQRVARILDLQADPELIQQALCRAGLATEQCLPGIRIPGAWSVFEAGCRAILGQQVSVKAAISQLNRLVETLGEATPYGVAFPSAASVADHELSFLKMPAKRREALRAFAQSCVNEEEQNLNESDWLALPGIGPWTVNYIQLRGLSQPDLYLQGDLVVRKQAQLHHIESDAAAPWRSYLTMQLWRLADEAQRKENQDV